MPRTGGKKKGGARERPAPGAETEQTRPGLPAPDSVVEVRRMERGGKVYRILRTDERDEYDKPEAPRRVRAGKKKQ